MARVLLLDTQVLLWWLSDDPRLGPAARNAMATQALLLSPASLWEIAIKAGLGKLRADVGLVSREATAQGMGRLPLQDAHFAVVQALPRPTGHGDPFDRILVAQAIVEEVTLLTADRKLAAYDVSLADASA